MDKWEDVEKISQICDMWDYMRYLHGRLFS